jgi:hypothetical protein
MKTNKRTTLVVRGIVIAILYLGLFISLKAIADYNAQKITNQLETGFDQVDQDMAIKQLSELRGMILEVKALSHKDIPQGILLDELEGITSSKHFANKYLDDFAFNVPSTSNLGELCEELISQIDDQIHNIEYGTKGE